MHTTEVTHKSYTLRCFHHGDWSGNAEVLLLEDEEIKTRVVIDGELLLRFAMGMARPVVESLVERISDALLSEDRLINIWRKLR